VLPFIPTVFWITLSAASEKVGVIKLLQTLGVKLKTQKKLHYFASKLKLSEQIAKSNIQIQNSLPIDSFICSTKPWGGIIGCGCGCAADAMPSAG